MPELGRFLEGILRAESQSLEDIYKVKGRCLDGLERLCVEHF